VVLEGRHVRLEPLAQRHVSALCEVGLDPELWRWTASAVRDAGEMARYVDTALEWQRGGHSLPFATVERATNRVVGTTRFGNYDPEHRRIEIGWTLVARAWQRTAINTEAKLLMLRHAFERLDLLRVELKTDALNTRSRQAIERLGAVQEGILRQHVVTWSGRVRDTVCYSVIHDEWPAVEARLLNLLARDPVS
jgi:RimJ/RimL family protein N-acetyltransferase